MDFVSKVERTIQEEQLLQQGDVIAVAVSGGPDSVALLHVLHKLASSMDLQLIAAHVNHQFRGTESDMEAKLVAALADKLGIHCEIGVIDVPAYIRENALNAQAAARDKRYEFLHEVADRHGANRIALAHHADDQAETLVMRLIRGTGPSGLSGIPIRRLEKKVELVRPLLRIYKAEIVAYCENEQLPVSSDSSNASRKYFRNRVRLDVLPFLMQYNSGLPQSLNRLAEMMDAENDYIEEETKRSFNEMVTISEEGHYFSANRFKKLPVALQRRLIKLILNYLFMDMSSFDFLKTETVRAAILQDKTSSMRLDLSEHIRFFREYERIGFVKKTNSVRSDYHYVISDHSGELIIAEAGQTITYRVKDSENSGAAVKSDKLSVSFDMEQLVFPLSVRNRRDGDRMEVVGLNGSKKVKNIFIDDKIGQSVRDRIPIVTDGNGDILWIPGVRRSKHALVDGRTKRLFQMEMFDPHVNSVPLEC